MRRALLALFVPLVLLAGCVVVTPEEKTQTMATQAEKTGTGTLRTDLSPLESRFPLLGMPVEATWYSGTMGSDSPGPTTYWIDAIVTVNDQVASQIEFSYGLQSSAPTPDVVDALKPDLPSDLWSSEAFSVALTVGGDPSFVATAAYSPSQHQVVFTARGQ